MPHTPLMTCSYCGKPMEADAVVVCQCRDLSAMRWHPDDEPVPARDADGRRVCARCGGPLAIRWRGIIAGGTAQDRGGVTDFACARACHVEAPDGR